MTTKDKIFFKLVCIGIDPFEYKVHEDVNRGSLDEVHQFIDDNIHKYPGAEWKLIPMTVTC